MRRCSFCKREVLDTRHLKDSCQVDYYILMLGKTRRVDAADPAKPDSGHRSYLQLVHPKEYMVCKDCREKTDVSVLIAGYPEPEQMPDV